MMRSGRNERVFSLDWRRARALWLGSLLAALLALAAAPAQAAGCTKFDWWIVDLYVVVPSSNFLSDTRPIYSDSSCTVVADDKTENFSPGTAFASSGPAALAICKKNMTQHVDYVRLATSGTTTYYCEVGSAPARPKEHLYIISNQPDADSALKRCRELAPHANHITPYGNIENHWDCWYVWDAGISGGGGNGSGSGGGSGGGGSAGPMSMAGVDAEAYDGGSSGAEFQRVDSRAVGNESVINMGFQDAVDVWSNVGSGYEVCFPQVGKIVFLDAATSPRQVVKVDYVVKDGQTCASLDRAGTVVLVDAPADAPADAPSNATPAPTRRPGTNDSANSAESLENCRVRTGVNLRLRAGPWGAVIDVIPAGTSMRAKGRTKSWFNVSYDGQDGWSAAWLLSTDGDCDFETDDS